MNDQIKELLDKLSDLDDSGITELEAQILSSFAEIEEFDEDPTPDTVANMTSLADALESVRTELTRRSEQAVALKAEAEKLTSRVSELKNDSDSPESSDAEDETLADAEDEDGNEDEDEDEDSKLSKKKMDDEEEVEVIVEDDKGDIVSDVDIIEEVPEGGDIDVQVDEDEEELRKKKKYTNEEDETLAVEDSDSKENTTPEEESPMTAATTPEKDMVVPPGNAVSPQTSSEQASMGIGLSIVAGASIPGVDSGEKLSSMDAVADAFTKRLHTLRNVTGGAGEQHTIATFNFDYPEEYRLSGNDESNIAKVNGVQALVAAAGICAPLETLYEMDVCGVTDRPVRDSLTRFNADRGGVRIFGAPTLACAAGTGHGLWDPAAPTDKICCDANCPTPADHMLDAVWACMNFSNFSTRFFPEVIKANTELAMVQHARAGEQILLKKIQDASTKVTFDAKATTHGGKGVGITRSLLLLVREVAAGMRRRHRMSANTKLRVILPVWVLDAMIADMALQMPGDGLETMMLARRKIEQFFTSSNINITWALDEITTAGAPAVIPAQAAGEVQGFPSTIEFPIYSEGSFLFLDGGTLDLGTVRVGDSIKKNEYSTFVETFEGVVNIGCEALWVTASNVCASGAAAALVDTSCS